MSTFTIFRRKGKKEEEETEEVNKPKVVRKSNNIKKKDKLTEDQQMAKKYSLPEDEYTPDKDYYDYLPNMETSEMEVLDNQDDVPTTGNSI